MNGQNPREIAARVLGQRKAGGEFTENLLDRALQSSSSSFSSSSSKIQSRTRTRSEDEDEKKLSSADRGLCQELVYGVVRWQAALDWLIDRKTGGREQRPGLQNLLRLGLYQIFWLDRIPPHAAVHESVELAKHSGFGQQSGFINAILRGYLRETDATRKLLDDLKAADPATGCSHPEWLVARWQKHFGADKTAQLLEWNNTPPKTFARVNALKFCSSRRKEALTSESEFSQSLLTSAATSELRDAGDLLARWREENVDYDFVRRDWLEENLVFELKSHPSLNSLASFRDGWFYVQDPGTLLAPRELGAQPGETVLDLCAAPGGKTTYLAQLMNNDGKIVACDISEDRLKLIRENCARLGVNCVEFCSSRGNEALSEKNETGQSLLTSAATKMKFDRILVDAPCSNTGVLRRRVDLRWRISAPEISRLQQTQLELLIFAATKLKPSGVLVYSTCSLEPEENSEVVKEFLAAHSNFKLETERALLPFADSVDGAYIARLKHST
jgi:16S rRNA (cytosine967-C5)-methyltransferase